MNTLFSSAIPKIIRETSDGYTPIEIRDDMFSRREIICTGKIDSDSANSLILQLRQLAYEDPYAEISMFINSPGGEVTSGLAIYDVMQTIPCKIRTVCTGMAASFGAVLFMAGDTREMLPHSKLMIHDPLIMGGGISGSALEVKKEAEKLIETKQILSEIIAKHSHRSLEEVSAKTEETTYFTPQEAIKFGIADKIISSFM